MHRTPENKKHEAFRSNASGASPHLSIDLHRSFVEREVQLRLSANLAQHLQTVRVEQ